VNPEGKFLVAKCEYGGSFVMSLEGDWYELEVTLIFEFLVTFAMSLEGVCHIFDTNFIENSFIIWRDLVTTSNFLKKLTSN
jgi:hypothetical protein